MRDLRSPYKSGKTQAGEFRGYGWFHVPRWNITIAAPPKGGSSSLKQFMWINEIECSYIPHNQVKGISFFVIRDPVSRFCSLWRSKCRDHGNIRHKHILYGMSPSELMDYIKSDAKDVHWTPQVKLIGTLAPILIPLEQLNSWWSESGYGKLQAFNTTEGSVDIDPKRIVDFYAKDMELYTNAVLNYSRKHPRY